MHTVLPKISAADDGGGFRLTAENSRSDEWNREGNTVQHHHINHAMQDRVMAAFVCSPAELHDGAPAGVGLLRSTMKPSLRVARPMQS